MTTIGEGIIIIGLLIYFLILGYLSYGLLFGKYYRRKGYQAWVTRDIIYGNKARIKSVINIILMFAFSCIPLSLMDGSGFSLEYLKENLFLIFQIVPRNPAYTTPLLIGFVLGILIHKRFIKRFLTNPPKSTWDVYTEVAKRNQAKP
jgi:hypothetical protein